MMTFKLSPSMFHKNNLSESEFNEKNRSNKIVNKKSRASRFNRYHLYAMLASLTLLLFVLGAVFLGDLLSQKFEPEVEIREINQVYTPPPPPPPSITKPLNEIQPTLNLDSSGDGPSINIQLKTKKIIDILPPPMINHDVAQLDVSLEIDWKAFGLRDLDSVPVNIVKGRPPFPKSLIRKGINKAKVKLDVFIDEAGTVSLIKIKEMPYPVLENMIKKLIRTSRFSIPTKNGKPVKARFIWPVEFAKK